MFSFILQCCNISSCFYFKLKTKPHVKLVYTLKKSFYSNKNYSNNFSF